MVDIKYRCKFASSHIVCFQTRQGVFDYITTFEQVQIVDQMAIFDFCPAVNQNVQGYMVDKDGSFNSNGNEPGSFVSPALMTFVHPLSCQSQNGGCFAYCESCFRTIRFETDPSATKDFMLQVCQNTGSVCDLIQGYTNPESDPTSADNLRVYNAHLPQGSYDVSFVDAKSGQEVWPTFVIEAIQPNLCVGGFNEGDIQLGIPTVDELGCHDLIRNGNSESLDGWLERSGGLALVSGVGINGSTALSDAPAQTIRDTISQFLDSRCLPLSHGRFYEIQAWVKLVDERGSPIRCGMDGLGCPEVRISTDSRTLPAVASVVPQTLHGDFHLLHGVLAMDEELSGSDKVEFAVRRNRDDVSMVLDDVSMTLMPVDNVCSGNLVENGDFSFGTAKFWSESAAEMSMSSRSGKTSLVLSNGTSGRVFLKKKCFEVGELYDVHIQFSLFRNDQIVYCDPMGSDNGLECPVAKLVGVKNGVTVGGIRFGQILENPPHAQSSSRTLYGVFTATQDQAQADYLSMQIENLNPDIEYHVSSVSVHFKPKECGTNMLVNGDMRMGITSFWAPVGSGTVEWTTPGYDDVWGAMLVHGRERSGHGPRYTTASYLDTRCLVPGSLLEIVAEFKVLDAATGQQMACNLDPLAPIHEDACPAVRVKIDKIDGTPIVDQDLRDYVNSAWNSEGWNAFRSTLTLPSTPTWDGPVSAVIQIRNFPIAMDALVDNFAIRQVA